MNEDVKAWLIITSIILAAMALAVGAGYWIANAKCVNKWERSGFHADYALWQGCLISKDGHVWIPAENYREVP